MCCFETCTFLPESTWVIIHKLRARTQGLLDSTYVPNGNSCAIFRPNGSSVGAEAAVLGGGAIRGAQLGGAEPERELTLTVVGRYWRREHKNEYSQKHRARVDPVRSLCAFVG